MTILSGCKSLPAPTVKIDTFCDGKYTSLEFTKHEYSVISEIRQTQEEVMDKFIKYQAMNEREYERCN